MHIFYIYIKPAINTRVNKKALASIKCLSHDMISHSSKSLSDISQITYDYIIIMGCGDERPLIQSHARIDWQIPDPKYLELEEFNTVRNCIKTMCLNFLKQ